MDDKKARVKNGSETSGTFKSLAEVDKTYFPKSGGREIRTPAHPTKIEARLIRPALESGTNKDEP
jgi:hypothetical protein